MEETGKAQSTVIRNLLLMDRVHDPQTGKPYPLVTHEGDQWRANYVDLARVAEFIGSAGSRKRQHQRHKAEQMEHAQFFRSQYKKQGEQQKDEPEPPACAIN